MTSPLTTFFLFCNNKQIDSMLQWVCTIHFRTLVSHWLVSFIFKNHLSTTIQLIHSFVYCFIHKLIFNYSPIGFSSTRSVKYLRSEYPFKSIFIHICRTTSMYCYLYSICYIFCVCLWNNRDVELDIYIYIAPGLPIQFLWSYLWVPLPDLIPL